MLFDVLDTILQVAIALSQVDLQQVSQQVLQISSEVRREPNLQHTQLIVTLVISN